MTKSISSFLAKSRTRNNESNRAEFLHSLEEQRKRANNPDAVDTTCARADAKFVDRDTQMKYDIAKNEDGPLKRTLRRKHEDDDEGEDSREKQKARVQDVDSSSPTIHSGIEERLVNIEKHVSVRYGRRYVSKKHPLCIF